MKKFLPFFAVLFIIGFSSCGYDNAYNEGSDNNEVYAEEMPATERIRPNAPVLLSPQEAAAVSAPCENCACDGDDPDATEMPWPAEPLNLPVLRRAIHTGRQTSAAITEDGTVWVWGAFPRLEGISLARIILNGVLDEHLLLFDREGEPFIPREEISGSGGTIFFFDVNSRRYRFDLLTVTNADGSEPPNLPIGAYANRLTPQRVGDNAMYVELRERTNWSTEEFFAYAVWRTEDMQDYAISLSANDAELLTFEENFIGVASFLARGTGQFGQHWHTITLTYNNEVWGHGNSAARGLPVDWDGPPLRDGMDIGGIRIMDGVVQIAVGREHTLALTHDGRLYSWGFNGNGQLGTGMYARRETPALVVENIVAIAAGDVHSMALDANGTLWGWGCNSQSQIGENSLTRHTYPIIVMEDVNAVAASAFHTLAVTNCAVLWGWGQNFYGQLGNSYLIVHSEPVQIKTGVMRNDR
ncbi:MAG: hypothetical protein FWC16_01475 [Defluviitaleaceae bacterium]|nr:hypothetical protein [Defluviitaleaceae bacterium]MCL2273575.1 hypothetical protein [Defluviitaleaceae bacterium]